MVFDTKGIEKGIKTDQKQRRRRERGEEMLGNGGRRF